MAETINQLQQIKGVGAVLAQAKELAAPERDDIDDKSLTEMLDDAERLRMGVSGLVLRLRDLHAESEDGKEHRALRKEITRVLATLERVEASLSEQLRRLGKKLAKADAKLTTVPQDDLEALTKGLRQTRKAIDKIVRP